ncbi:MAG: hypothetical protein ABSE48_19855 [Verrucomicrobiota bacterium]
MKLCWRNPFFILGVVLLWRIALLIFTAQPVPSNDAFIFDGGMANWLKHGLYVNPCIEVGYPISSGKVFSIYPPVYQVALLAWMPVFGASAFSIMAMHLVMFGIDAWLALVILKHFFPAETNYAWAALLLFGITFNDRPEDLAHIFGLSSLWLVNRQIAGTRHDARVAGATFLALLFTLYTSLVVGAVYFGAGFFASAMAWWFQRKKFLVLPFFLAAASFVAILFWVIEVHPLWWQGFLENGEKQSVVGGFHAPRALDLVKLVRTVPVFLAATATLPWVWARRRQLTAEPWLLVAAGCFVMGVITLCLAMTFVSPNYVGYAVYLEIIVAAGLLALVDRISPNARRLPQILILGCVLLVGVRAVGMTTWGAACAWNNSYWQTRKELRVELAPFVNSDAPVVISSAYLYSSLAFGVKHPIHADWYFDRGVNARDQDFQGMKKLRPPKLVLTQFDYYRGFGDVLNKLRQHPELVAVTVRDETKVRTPDSIPSMQRILQNISWAPIIVDLDWK